MPLGEGQRLAAGILGVSVSFPRNIFLSHKTSFPEVTSLSLNLAARKAREVEPKGWSPKLSLPRHVLITLGRGQLLSSGNKFSLKRHQWTPGVPAHKTCLNVRAKPHHAQVLLPS